MRYRRLTAGLRSGWTTANNCLSHHVLIVLRILEVVYVAEGRQPLIRHRSRYRREL